MERKKICIIGGGASGLMAAIMAAREGGEVTLLEHNEKTGKKLLATGNGRCTLTNICQEPSCYHSLSGNLAWEIPHTGGLHTGRIEIAFSVFRIDADLREKANSILERKSLEDLPGQIP